MSININDLNECFEINTSSPFSDRDSLKDLRELSPEELKISGGAGHYLGHHRTVVIS